MIATSLKDIAAACDGEFSAPDVTVSGVSIDSRTIEPGSLFIAIPGDRFDGHDFVAAAATGGAAACVCAMEHQKSLAAAAVPIVWVDDTVKALARLAAWYRRERLPASTIVVAVTGSNGKTTTKRMIDHLLGDALPGFCSPKSFNNHIGVPLTLLMAEPTHRYVVVEIGTSAPGEIASLATIARPNAAIITSLGEAHLEYLGDIHTVAMEKSSLLEFVHPHGVAVVNFDHPILLPQVHARASCRVLSFGTHPRCRLRVTDCSGDIHRTRFLLDGRYEIELPLPGAHHATNAAAAFAVGRWFGMDPDAMIRRLRTLEPVEQRARRIEFDGITLVDDTYNANPASMAAAIEMLAGHAAARRVLVMGDMMELGAATEAMHDRILAKAVAARFEWLVLVGEQMARAAGPWLDANGQQITICRDAAKAGKVLAAGLRAGDTVLVKASRGMELERAIERLRQADDRTSAVA